jgi:phage terminase large subunit-like protein
LSALSKKAAAERLLAINDKLLTQKAARSDLAVYAKLHGFRINPHQQLIIDYLHKIEEGEIDRLMIFSAPGSSKSTYVSRLFPQFYLARHPQDKVICASHTLQLSAEFSRRVRDDLATWGGTLGIKVDPNHKAAESWALTSGGRYYAASVGMAVAGRRANLIVCDDLVKSREAAFSQQERSILNNWFDVDLRTRLVPGGKIVLVMTRFHVADIAGHLLEQTEHGGEKWVVLRIPCESEGEGDPLGRPRGEFLWGNDPSYDYAGWAQREKQNKSSADWSSLFQGTPIIIGGNFLDATRVKEYTQSQLPARETLSIYMGTDYATRHAAGDYSAVCAVAVDLEGNWWLLDLWRGQVTTDVAIDKTLEMVRRWKPVFQMSIERGVLANAMAPMFEQRMRDTRTFVPIRQYTRKADKPTMATSLQAKIGFSGLYVPKGATYLPELMKELSEFPAGATDDIVDSLVSVSMLIPRMAKGIPPPPPPGAGFPRWGPPDFLSSGPPDWGRRRSR